MLHLLPFDQEDIQAMLRVRFPTEWERYWRQIERTYNLAELAQRPVLLDMMARSLPDLQPGQAVNAARLYEAYTDLWLLRDEEKGRTLITRAEKRLFMQELALEMLRREQLSIHYSRLPERVRTHFRLEKAARGIDGRLSPGVEAFDPARCNTNESNIGTTTPVGRYSPDGDSPYTTSSPTASGSTSGVGWGGVLLLLSPRVLDSEFLVSDRVNVAALRLRSGQEGDPPLADFEVFANYPLERGSAEGRKARKGVPAYSAVPVLPRSVVEIGWLLASRCVPGAGCFFCLYTRAAYCYGIRACGAAPPCWNHPSTEGGWKP